MSEFVLWSAPYFHRGFDRVLANQRQQRWNTPRQVAAQARTVGIMGLGRMGLPVANTLLQAGFRVRGWSRDIKQLEGITCYAGRDALHEFLSGADMLVCLVPLTAQTRGLINAAFLRHLPTDAKLIHVGRGEQLVMDDLIDALNNKTLGGAIVDVFDAEPLSSDHPAWTTPNLVVIPHMASLSSVKTLAEQVAANISRMQRGENLCNQVDIQKGF